MTPAELCSSSRSAWVAPSAQPRQPDGSDFCAATDGERHSFAAVAAGVLRPRGRAGGSDFGPTLDPFVVRRDGHAEVPEEACQAEKPETVGPRLAEPNRSLPSLGRVTALETKADPRASRVENRARDCNPLTPGVGEVDPGDLGQLGRETRAQRSRIDQAGERRLLDALEPHVDDWSGCQVAAACGGKLAKEEISRGGDAPGHGLILGNPEHGFGALAVASEPRDDLARTVGCHEHLLTLGGDPLADERS